MQNSFEPIHLALTLLKGYAKEYKDRNWFDQIYFSKLSMYHEQEGYIPILYDFKVHHDTVLNNSFPNKILMTFHYPKNRLSKLNGLVIIGGEPDIYSAYKVTQVLTPALESLFLEKHDIEHNYTIEMIDTTLSQLSHPQRIKTAIEIMERSYSKKGDDLATFFPLLDKKEASQQKLALPQNFMIDGVFMIKISDEFFTSNQIGDGIKSMRLYQRNDGQAITPRIVFPLVFKWQPIYNDILNNLTKSGQILPQEYQGVLIPNIVIFKHRESEENTALFSTISIYEETPYLYVALAKSGYSQGQPLSLLHAALKREKFGASNWVDQIEENAKQKENKYDNDLIATKLIKTVEETDLTTEGVFDLGKLRSIKSNQGE